MHKIYKHGADVRVLPKWHLESGESDEQAALRETTEETGYTDMRILTHLYEDTFEYGDETQHNQKTVTRFLWQLSSDARSPLWLTEAEQGTIFEQIWLSPLDAYKQLTYPGEKNAIQKAVSHLQK